MINVRAALVRSLQTRYRRTSDWQVQWSFPQDTQVETHPEHRDEHFVSYNLHTAL